MVGFSIGVCGGLCSTCCCLVCGDRQEHTQWGTCWSVNIICITGVHSSFFIIHPCDPTVVMCYLIRPCDIAVRITYLISHSSSLSYNTVIKKIFQVGCIINTKLPSCVDIIRRTSLGFPSWCPESTRPTDSCFQGTSCIYIT